MWKVVARKEEEGGWNPPKPIRSQKTFVRDVNMARLLCFPERTGKSLGRNM